MKAKLIRKITGIYKLELDDKLIACDDVDMQNDLEIGKLSKQNCNEIFGVVDVNSQVEDIVKTICPDDRGKDVIYGTGMAVGIQCFNKAMELNKDKVFTLEDIRKAYYVGYEDGKSGATFFQQLIQSLQQPTEIEVEFEMQCLDPTCDGVNKKGVCIPGNKPKLDENGCLILKKVMS
jgi:hypothetical protein